MLASARLRDDTFFAHAQRQQALPERVVDLVRSRVAQVFALDHHVQSRVLAQPLGFGERGRASHVLAAEALELSPKAGIGPCLAKGGVELVQGGDEGFGHVSPAKGAEPAAGIGKRGHSVLFYACRPSERRRRSRCANILGKP